MSIIPVKIATYFADVEVRKEFARRHPWILVPSLAIPFGAATFVLGILLVERIELVVGLSLAAFIFMGLIGAGATLIDRREKQALMESESQAG